MTLIALRWTHATKRAGRPGLMKAIAVPRLGGLLKCYRHAAWTQRG